MYALHNLFKYLLFIFRFGSEELKQEFLKPSISGDVVSCVGISEVHCGSDVASKIFFFLINCCDIVC